MTQVRLGKLIMSKVNRRKFRFTKMFSNYRTIGCFLCPNTNEDMRLTLIGDTIVEFSDITIAK
jgi:3'-phosphoadenosine 5'-phosphosulfate sulfotransferase (PAPS reductase)/FAD synthetase